MACRRLGEELACCVPAPFCTCGPSCSCTAEPCGWRCLKSHFNNAFICSFQMTRRVSALSPTFERKVLVICASSVNNPGSIAAGRPAPLSSVLTFQRRSVSSWIEPKMSGHKNCARRKESSRGPSKSSLPIPRTTPSSLVQRAPRGALETDHSPHPLFHTARIASPRSPSSRGSCLTAVGASALDGCNSDKPASASSVRMTSMPSCHQRGTRPPHPLRPHH